MLLQVSSHFVHCLVESGLAKILDPQRARKLILCSLITQFQTFQRTHLSMLTSSITIPRTHFSTSHYSELNFKTRLLDLMVIHGLSCSTRYLLWELGVLEMTSLSWTMSSTGGLLDFPRRVQFLRAEIWLWSRRYFCSAIMPKNGIGPTRVGNRGALHFPF